MFTFVFFFPLIYSNKEQKEFLVFEPNCVSSGISQLTPPTISLYPFSHPIALCSMRSEMILLCLSLLNIYLKIASIDGFDFDELTLM